MSAKEEKRRPTSDVVEIATFEGPETYHALLVVRMSDGTHDLKLKSGVDDGWQTILDGVGRWFSKETDWGVLEDEL